MKNLQHKVCIFCTETVKICTAASGNISMFFKERAAASEKIFKKKCATASERKFAAAS